MGSKYHYNERNPVVTNNFYLFEDKIVMKIAKKKKSKAKKIKCGKY